MRVPRIALIGAPNSGKSTLFNRLVGRRKALVHREPGMTRDVNEESCTWYETPVVLLDTGGLLGPGDSMVAGEVRTRVLEAVADADVLIFLADGQRGMTPQDAELARLFRRADRPIVLAVNKIDTPRHEDRAAEFHRLGLDPVLAISAEHGTGIERLYEAILPHLSTIPVPREAPDDEGAVSIAIAGRPNVGKSSLLNALLGQDRVIVSDVPGTTRDAIDTDLQVGDKRYRIIDTAGLRRRGHVARGPESLSVMAARRRIERADVVLLLLDGIEGPTKQDLHVSSVAQKVGRPFAVLLNKWDQAGRQARAEGMMEDVRHRMKFAPYAPILTVSAITGFHVPRILPLVDAIHEEAVRRLGTAALNRWLERAARVHAPPSTRGRETKLHYAAQTGVNPPAVLIFTNREEIPHFSYRRYLENSLREAFALTRTPVIVKYRKKPRAARDLGRRPGKGRKLTV